MFISSTEEGDKSGYRSWWFLAAGVGTVGSCAGGPFIPFDQR